MQPRTGRMTDSAVGFSTVTSIRKLMGSVERLVSTGTTRARYSRSATRRGGDGGSNGFEGSDPGSSFANWKVESKVVTRRSSRDMKNPSWQADTAVVPTQRTTPIHPIRNAILPMAAMRQSPCPSGTSLAVSAKRRPRLIDAATRRSEVLRPGMMRPGVWDPM